MTEMSDHSAPLSDRSSPARLMIVEDELRAAEDLKRRLEKCGYHIPSIHTRAEETISSISEVAPNLILMDISLDGETDGIAAAGIIRDEFQLPVVFLTSHADGDTLV